MTFSPMFTLIYTQAGFPYLCIFFLVRIVPPN